MAFKQKWHLQKSLKEFILHQLRLMIQPQGILHKGHLQLIWRIRFLKEFQALGLSL